ncbi:MAG: hypothetical protein JSR46_07960, partial [Verrucomicrobia bacterium]|nr:hypothetical protein [Verrucomicrobiota bacterium]
MLHIYLFRLLTCLFIFSVTTLGAELNVVIISPHFPANHRSFCIRLQEAGVRVLGIDQVPLPDELKDCMDDYYQVSDLHHYSELVQACHYFQ